MIQEIKSILGITELPSGVDTTKLEEFWSNEQTKIYAIRYVVKLLETK
jgi:hypothetical protein